jgi:AAA domain
MSAHDDDRWPEEIDPDVGTRRIILTAASDIRPRPVFWLWKNRLALGTLGLLAGRQGVGKSTLAYWIAAKLTRGDLYGHYEGTPKSVLVCASEDSWEHTIVPRLIASGADRTRIFRMEVLSSIDARVGLTLPRDLDEVEKSAMKTDAALMLLDPLMSRLGKLDTHKDAEVRQALEPLVDACDRVSMSALGLIHHNKSGSTDPLQLVMASTAFSAVARSVHTVMRDPDDDTGQRRLFGTPKNNLGRDDLPTFSFTISGHPVDTDEGIAWTGRLDWGDEQTSSIEDAMARSAENGDDKSAVSEAADWLTDYLETKGGQVPSADAKKAGRAAGHTEASVKRARSRLHLVVSIVGYPRTSFWELPSQVDPTGADGSTPSHVSPLSPLSTVSVGERSSTSTTTTTYQSAQSAHGSGTTRASRSDWEQTELGKRNPPKETP